MANAGKRGIKMSKYIIKNCGCIGKDKECWNFNRDNEYCKDYNCLLKQIVEIAKRGLSENVCMDFLKATTPPKEYFILGHTFQDRPQLDCARCISRRILQFMDIKEFL